jgi:8-oxo-dGTP diphosphatase
VAVGVEDAVAEEATLLGVSVEDVVRAAGGVVVRGDGSEREVALVHRPRYDDWSLPKGKLLDGEPEDAAAVREVWEETGLRCRLGAEIGAVTYADRFGRPKVVRYWVMTPEDGTFAPSDEVDELRWARLVDAEELLTYPHDRALLRSMQGLRASAPVYLLRHAKAGKSAQWSGPDEDRPITRRGRRQSRRLVERFEGLDIGRIVSSPFVRCVQTVEPLAAARGLEVEAAAELAEETDIEIVLGFLSTLAEEPTVVCGHGPEISALVLRFEADGVDLSGLRGLAKGSVWVLEREGGRFVSARYLPAPAG